MSTFTSVWFTFLQYRSNLGNLNYSTLCPHLIQKHLIVAKSSADFLNSHGLLIHFNLNYSIFKLLHV